MIQDFWYLNLKLASQSSAAFAWKRSRNGSRNAAEQHEARRDAPQKLIHGRLVAAED